MGGFSGSCSTPPTPARPCTSAQLLPHPPPSPDQARQLGPALTRVLCLASMWPEGRAYSPAMAASPLDGASHYVPILKGRLGELKALEQVDKGLLGKFTPLLEVVPSNVDYNEEGEPDPASVKGDVSRFIARLANRWPHDQRIIVDAGLLPARPGSVPPSVDLSAALGQENLSATVTIRPSDPPEVIEGVGDEQRQWGLDGACIRLSGEDLDDQDQPIPDTLERVLELLRMKVPEVDLILDLGAVSDEKSATFAARIARLVLADLPDQQGWRTLVVAAGAFPPDLSGVQPFVPTQVPRHDAMLWRSVSSRTRGRIPNYGDYAIAYPVQTGSAGFAPAPQLRYTLAENWLVVKGRRRERRGSAQFLDLCERIAEHTEFTRNLSWGDRRIEQAARAAHDEDATISGGNAMMWRAIGTSHHLALVASRLATIGEP
jgi:hypothetical protein